MLMFLLFILAVKRSLLDMVPVYNMGDTFCSPCFLHTLISFLVQYLLFVLSFLYSSTKNTVQVFKKQFYTKTTVRYPLHLIYSDC